MYVGCNIVVIKLVIQMLTINIHEKVIWCGHLKYVIFKRIKCKSYIYYYWCAVAKIFFSPCSFIETCAQVYRVYETKISKLNSEKKIISLPPVIIIYSAFYKTYKFTCACAMHFILLYGTILLYIIVASWMRNYTCWECFLFFVLYDMSMVFLCISGGW